MSVRTSPGNMYRTPVNRGIAEFNRERYVIPRTVSDGAMPSFGKYKIESYHKPRSNVMVCVMVVLIVLMAIFIGGYFMVHVRCKNPESTMIDAPPIMGGETCPTCGASPCVCALMHGGDVGCPVCGNTPCSCDADFII